MKRNTWCSLDLHDLCFENYRQVTSNQNKVFHILYGKLVINTENYRSPCKLDTYMEDMMHEWFKQLRLIGQEIPTKTKDCGLKDMPEELPQS